MLQVKWLKDQGFGGAMIWSLDLDDFRQACKSSDRPYPLLNVIHDLLTSGKVKPTTRPEPTRSRPTRKIFTTTHIPTTTTTNDGKGNACV